LYKLVVIVALLALAACARDPSYYRNTSSLELCVSYLTKSSLNIHQSARASELDRRGENCSQYAEAAAARRNSNADYKNANNKQINSSQSAPKNNSDVYVIQQGQGTHTYVVNGRTKRCTTAGLVTKCF